MKNIIILIGALTLGGCVASPESIPPLYTERAPYDEMPCDELLVAKQEATLLLAELSKKQSSARARSITYNLLLVVGSGALTKDRSEQIGMVKGKIQAIEGALIGCDKR